MHRCLVRTTRTLRRGAGATGSKSKRVALGRLSFRKFTSISRNFRRYKPMRVPSVSNRSLISTPVASILLQRRRSFSSGAAAGSTECNAKAKPASIAELVKEYKTPGGRTPVDILELELEAIRKLDPRINAIVYNFDKGELLKQARQSARRYQDAQGKSEEEAAGILKGPLDGVPVTLKDASQIKGYRCNFGSFFLEIGAFEFMGFGEKEAPKENELAVQMLEDNGAIALCVTTTPELCCTENCSTFINGVTRNPHNLMRSPGGSSGGAGALMAKQVGYINMGSDMGGSIRIPSANCGCYGFKPSYSIAKEGPAKFPYFAVSGPLCANVDDIIVYMQCLQQALKDSLEPMAKIDFSNGNIKKGGLQPLDGLKVAVSKNLNGTIDYIDADVWDGVQRVASALQDLGAKVEMAEPPLEGPSANKIALKLLGTEFSKYAEKVRAFKNGEYEKLVPPFIMHFCDEGANITSKDLVQGLHEYDVMRYTMREFMKKYDLLLMPTTPIPARETNTFQEEGYMTDMIDGKRKTIGDCKHAASSMTTLANVTQQPAMAIPTGTTNDFNLDMGKLPTSAMLLGRVNEDDVVLKAAFALQNGFPAIPALDTFPDKL